MSLLALLGLSCVAAWLLLTLVLWGSVGFARDMLLPAIGVSTGVAAIGVGAWLAILFLLGLVA